uniref:Uncharacterized protein n=1 Tax=Arundo donax TaxID=35708 RepID=A0A0A9AI30_ARUDO
MLYNCPEQIEQSSVQFEWLNVDISSHLLLSSRFHTISHVNLDVIVLILMCTSWLLLLCYLQYKS